MEQLPMAVKTIDGCFTVATNFMKATQEIIRLESRFSQ
jgi:hypothetical protein